MTRLIVDKTEGGSSEKFEIANNAITSWKLITNIPKDASARAREVLVGVEIKGFIVTSYKDSSDNTLKLAEWARKKSSDIEAYRTVGVQEVTSDIVERQITLQNAYVANYTEHFDGGSGEGTFAITIRVRRMMNQEDLYKYEYGFNVQE